MYRKTMFCLREMYTSTYYNPDSLITSPRGGGYSQIPPGCIGGCFPAIRWSALCLNTPSVWPIQGITTHVSNTKSSTSYNTALNKLTDFRASSPSLLSILEVQYHLFLALWRFFITSGQSLSVSISSCPRYLNSDTFVSGRT